MRSGTKLSQYLKNFPSTLTRYVIGSIAVIEERITSSTISCSNQQTMSGELKCLLELDSYGEIVGCRDMTHLQNCSKL